MNSNDIKSLKKKYMFFKKYITNFYNYYRNSDESAVTLSQFLLYAEVPDIPLVDYLFSCFKNSCMEWNDFFQFVIYYSLCPMSSYLYTLLHIRQNYDGLINFDLVIELYSLVEAEKEIKFPNNVEAFHDLDLNKDNCINFCQFCKFFDKSFPSCDLFYIFRIKLLAYFFPDSKYRTILNRRKKITEIKEYQSKHNDRLPNDNSSCIEVIINSLFDTNPNRYDYDCDLTDISFYDITAMMIRKYNPIYKIKKRKRQSGRFLNKLLHYVVLNEIDSFYMEYHKAVPPQQPILPPPYLIPLSPPHSQQQIQNSDTGTLQMPNRKISVVSMCSTDSCSSSILRKSSFGVLKQRKPTYHQVNSRSSIIAFQLYKRSIQLSQPPILSNEMSVSTPTDRELQQARSDSNNITKNQSNTMNCSNNID